jgi:hypothetical protein
MPQCRVTGRDTSLPPIQSTSYGNANSIYLANWQICLLHGVIQLSSLASFLPATWVSHPWRSGGQHSTLWNSYVETLQHILPNIPDNGAIDSWLPLAQNREQWKTLGTEWMKRRQAALTIYQYGPHPLLGDGILDHPFLWYLQDIHCRFSIIGGHVWSIFLCFLLCYCLIITLRSRALHRVLFWRFNAPDALILYVMQAL